MSHDKDKVETEERWIEVVCDVDLDMDEDTKQVNLVVHKSLIKARVVLADEIEDA